MLKSEYIEDIFLQFYDLILIDDLPIQTQDLTAASSFYSVLIQGKELTQNQANFILKLLAKYKTVAQRSTFYYTDALIEPKWKNSFRILDLSKKIFVEKDSDGAVWVCAKFPYQLKKEFDAEFDKESKAIGFNSWDADRKLRKLYLYDTNLIQLYEFALKHNFEIDETFMITMGEVEEIWQNQDEILPQSAIVDDVVILENSSDETFAWWESHHSGNVEKDLLLAKSMGYMYSGKPTTIIEKIAASEGNSFWIKNNQDFFSLYKSVSGKACVLLDRTTNTIDWLKTFVNDADTAGITRSDIKVCFRESKDQNTGINDWIKENNVGGKVEDGNILIFEFKPAKWLFKEQERVTMLVSNNLYPATNLLSKDWLESHPLVIYLGDIKPSTRKGHKIVEL